MHKHFLICLILNLAVINSYADEPQKALASKHDKAVEVYLEEFSSPEFKTAYPNIYQALVNSLNKLPDKVFKKVTNRRDPIIFINSITSGIARYANAKEFVIKSTDRPALQNGFYLIVLGDELNNAPDVEAIEGVILHEIAHDYLGHLRKEAYSCQLEREANQAVKEWGYNQEYTKASDFFGAKKKGDSNCSDLEQDPSLKGQKK